MAFKDYINQKEKEKQETSFGQYARQKAGGAAEQPAASASAGSSLLQQLARQAVAAMTNPLQIIQSAALAPARALNTVSQAAGNIARTGGSVAGALGANGQVNNQVAAQMRALSPTMRAQEAARQQAEQAVVNNAALRYSLQQASRGAEAQALGIAESMRNMGKGQFEQTARGNLAPYSGMLGPGASRATQGLTQQARQLIGLEQRYTGLNQPYRTRLLDAAENAVAQRSDELAKYASSDDYAAAQRAEAERLRNQVGPILENGRALTSDEINQRADAAMARYYEELPYTRDFKTHKVGDNPVARASVAMSEEFGKRGNVDLWKRPMIPGSRMASMGWTDAGDGTATLFSSTYSAGNTSEGYDLQYGKNVVINATPIREDGLVLTPGQLDRYIEKLTKSGDILEADKPINGGQGLIISVDDVTGSLDEAYDKAGMEMERLHELQETYYDEMSVKPTPVEYELMDSMEPIERQTFTYLQGTQGMQAALDYLNSIRQTLEARRIGRIERNMQQLGKEDPVLASAASAVANIAGNIESGGYVAGRLLDAAGRTAGRLFDRGNTSPQALAEYFRNNLSVDENSRWFTPQVMRDSLRAGVSADMSPIGRFIYQSGMSGVVDSTLNMLTFGRAGEVMMGLGAMADTVRETKQRGGDDTQAMGMGIVAGAAEVITEHLGFERVRGLFGESRDKIFSQLLTSGLSEFGEEAASEIANIMSDIIIMGDKNELDENVRRYVADGMSRQEAEKRALIDTAKQIGLAGLGGALGGLVMGGGSAATGQLARLFDTTVQGVARLEMEKMGKAYDQRAREVFLNSWDGKTTPAEYKTAFDALYDSGRLGVSLEQTQETAGEALRGMEPARQYQIWQAGENAAQAERQEYTDPISGEDFTSEMPTRKPASQQTSTATNAQAENATAGAENNEIAAGRDSTVIRDAEPAGNSDKFAEVPGSSAKKSEFQGGVVRAFQARKLTHEQRLRIRNLDMIGKRLGMEIVMVDSLRGLYNGAHMPGKRKIYVALDTTAGAYVQVAGHEMVHYIRSESEESYQVLARLVDKYLRETDGYNLDERIKMRIIEYADAQQQLTEGLEGTAMEEIVAETVPQIFADEAYIREIVQQDATLGQKIRETIENCIRVFRQIIEEITGRNYEDNVNYAFENKHPEAALLIDQTEKLQEMAKAFESAMEKANEAYEARQAARETAEANAETALTNAETALTGEQEEMPAAASRKGEEIAEGVVRYAAKVDDEEKTSVRIQLRKAQARLKGMEAVASVTVALNEITDKYEWARKQVEKIGDKVTRPGFATVDMSYRRIKNGFAYSPTPYEVAAITAVPSVIKEGIEIDHHENHKKGIKESWTFAAPVTINGVRGDMAVVVNRSSDYFYKVNKILLPDGTVFVIQEKNNTETGTHGKGTGNTQITHGTGSVSKDNITDKPEPVKGEESNSLKNQSRFSLKSAQLELIQRTNPMTDDYHVGIKAESDIKTAEEALGTRNDDEWYVYPDWTWEDGQRALTSGRVTLYSSHPIEEGTFVSPSRMMASDYAGGGKIHSKRVSVNDVAWINADEGQYAPVSEQPGVRFALKNTSDTPVETERVLEGIDGRGAIDVPGTGLDNGATITRVTPNEKALKKAHDEVKRSANRFLKETDSEYSRDDFQTKLIKLTDEIAQNGASDNTLEEATKLARAVIEQSNASKEEREKYKDLRRKLRDTPVTLTETQKAEAANIAGSYGAFRRSVFGTFNLSNEGKSLDAIWQEWSQIAPDVFRESVTEGDMVQALVDARAALMPKVSNPYGEDMDGASVDLGLRIQQSVMEALGDKAGAEGMADAVKALRSQYYDAMKDERDRIKLQQRAAFDQIAAALRDARDTDDEAAKDAAMAAYRGQMKRIGAEEAEAQARLAYRLRFEDRAERAKTWERITKYATDMRNTLAKPNKKKHVPQELQKDLLGVLEGLDFTRNGRVSEDTQAWKDSLTRIDQFLNEQLLRQQDPEGDTRGIWMSVCKPALDLFHANVDVIKNARGPINQMTLNEMKNLSSALAQVNHAINSINEMWTNARHETVDEVAGRTMDELDKVRTNRAQNSIALIRMLDNMLNIENLDAGSFFQRLGKAAGTVYDSLREGQSKAYARIREASEAAKTIFTNKKKEIRQWAKEQHDVGVSFGAELRTVKMTGTQLMELYALSRREQGRKHLLTDGFRLDGEGGKLGDTRTYKMTEDQLNAAVSQLSADQKATTERMQDYLSHTVSEWGNEVTEAMYLYRLFGEDYYWPIRSEKGYQRTREQDGTVLFNALTNAGFTKNVQDMVSNPLMIGDAITTFSGHVSDMATFSGLAMPVDDLLRWYNYAARDENGRVAYTTSVKKEIERTTGRGGLTYIQNLLDSLNGMGKSAQESAFATWMMSSYKRAAIMAKLRVVIQQPTAILRASAEINPVYLMEALATVGGHNIQEMQDHSALAWWKGNGNYEIGTGQTMKSIITGMQDSAKDDAFEALNSPAGAADDLGWRAIWIAVKRETAAKHKDLAVGSDAYWEQVTSRFEEICMKTQVVDTVLTRSAMMRSKSALQKMATAFMSEPTKNYNLMRTAISDFYQAVTSHDATARHRAEGKIMRYGMAIATATALNALVTAAFDALKYYDPEDKDEEGNPVTRLDLMLDNWLGDFTGSMNPLTNIPYVKDVYAVVTGEDVERMDLSTIGRLMNAVNRADKYFRQGNPNGYTTWAAVKPLVTGLGDVLGLPVSGLVANTEFALNIIQPGFTRSKARAATVSGAVEELYEAITSGDREKADRLRANMEKGQYGRDSMSEKEISKKLTDMLARNDDRVRQAWEAKQDIDGGAIYTRLRNTLMSDGWTKDEANYAIDHYDDVMIADAKKGLKDAIAAEDAEQAEAWRDVLRDYGQTEEQIAKAEAEKDLEETLESPKATYRDLYQMLRAGETAEASDLRGQLRAQGKTPEEISKGMADQLAMNDDRIQALWEKRQKGKANTAADYRPIQADGFTDQEVKQAVNRYPNIVQSEAKDLLLQAQKDGDRAAMETYRQRLISVGTKEETIDKWLTGKDMDAELEDVAVYKTENLMASIRSAETTAADIQDIRDYLMSKSTAADPMKSIQSSITSAFKDEYIDLVTSGKAKEAERLKKNMLMAGAKEDTIDNWVPSQEKADATATLKAAIDKGDARAAEREVDRIRDEEIMDVSAIVTRLNSAYKQKYFDLLDAGREREADALADMLAGLGLKKKNGENYYSGSWWNEQYRDYLKKKEE